MRTHRRLPAAVCLVGLLFGATVLLAPSPARAHGGRFIPPSPPLGPPPGPKIPAPPATTPTPVAPPTTPPSAPPLTGPAPGTLPPAPAGPFATGPTRRTVPVADANATWQTWWNLNRLAFLPERDAVFARQVTTPAERDDPRFWARRRAEVGAAQVTPFLLGLVDAKAGTRDDVVASALIALGKIARGPAVVDVLFARLEDPRAAQIVRESAALAVGLLRRSDPELRLGAPVLDAVRERLLAAIDDRQVPVRARAFAVLSLGMLGDQPYATPYTKDGRLVVRALWTRLGRPYARRDVPMALLTALGQLPPAGVPDAVREGLRRMVAGKSVHGRRWDGVERGHALTTALRLGGPDRHALLQRVLLRPREDKEVRRAAFLALGVVAPDLTSAERVETAKAVLGALKKARDPLSSGVGHLGLGHLLGADLRAGSADVLVQTRASRILLSEARSGASTTRGFSVLALSVAMHRVEGEDKLLAGFLAEGRDVLLRELTRDVSDPDLRAAYAVAVGVAGLGEARAHLLAIVGERGLDPRLRGHAAVSLGWLGPPGPDVERVLHLALADPIDLDLRRQAALGLALLGGRGAPHQLLRQLESGRTERLLAQVVVALGRLGDLAAVEPLRTYASDDGRSELAQSLAVVALGILVDPEPRPSLLRLTTSSYYPGRTESLDEAYTIL